MRTKIFFFSVMLLIPHNTQAIFEDIGNALSNISLERALLGATTVGLLYTMYRNSCINRQLEEISEKYADYAPFDGHASILVLLGEKYPHIQNQLAKKSENDIDHLMTILGREPDYGFPHYEEQLQDELCDLTCSERKVIEKLTLLKKDKEKSYLVLSVENLLKNTILCKEFLTASILQIYQARTKLFCKHLREEKELVLITDDLKLSSKLAQRVTSLFNNNNKYPYSTYHDKLTKEQNTLCAFINSLEKFLGENSKLNWVDEAYQIHQVLIKLISKIRQTYEFNAEIKKKEIEEAEEKLEKALNSLRSPPGWNLSFLRSST